MSDGFYTGQYRDTPRGLERYVKGDGWIPVTRGTAR